MRKLRYREVKKFAHHQTANKWQKQNSAPDILTPVPTYQAKPPPRNCHPTWTSACYEMSPTSYSM